MTGDLREQAETYVAKARADGHYGKTIALGLAKVGWGAAHIDALLEWDVARAEGRVDSYCSGETAEGIVPLVLAVEHGQLDANAPIQGEFRLLHMAVGSGYVAFVRLLLEHGADVTATDDHEGLPCICRRPLHSPAESRGGWPPRSEWP